MEKQLPKQISPCPIREAILEIRYETNLPGDAIFGLLYSAFKNEFPSLEKLPVLQIPEPLRTTDPNLMFLPEYRLTSGEFLLLVGQRTFALAVSGEYCGWTKFKKRADAVLEKLQSLEFIDTVTRLGIRYINIFDFNIFERSTLRLMRNDEVLRSSSSQIVAQLPAGDYENTLRVAQGDVVSSDSNIVGKSVIDIDTFTEQGLTGFFDQRDKLLSAAHDEEKKLFFSLLRDDYLESLDPKY